MGRKRKEKRKKKKIRGKKRDGKGRWVRTMKGGPSKKQAITKFGHETEEL